MGGDKTSMQFYHVLHKRNHRHVKSMVFNEGVSVNHMFPDGSYPIHIAAEKGDHVNLEFLLSLKAWPDLKNRHDQTALMLGIQFPEVVQLLINYKARVNIIDGQRRTALHLAGARGLNEVVMMLLAARAKVNAQDKWGRTPLHVTLLNIPPNKENSSDYTQVVQVLISHGADVNKQDRHHSSPLFLAVNHDRADIAKLLIACGAHIDRPSRHHLTPLMLATMKGFLDICRLLIRHNCNVNMRQPDTDKSCLQIAVHKGHLEIAKLLVGAGIYLEKERWLYVKSKPRNVHYTEEMSKWLTELLSEPQSLQCICRTKIREHLGRDIHNKVTKLNYPERLKQYVEMEDLL